MKSTVDTLQASAVELIKRMCALTEADVAGWHWNGADHGAAH